MADAGKFEVELETGDAVIGAAQLEIHVAEMVLGADNVGKKLVTLQLSVFTMFGDEPDRDSRDHAFNRNASVHERKHSTTHAGH